MEKDINNLSEIEREMYIKNKQRELDDQDNRRDSMRQMSWFALCGMLLYPFSVVLASSFGLESASKILGDMASTYFVSVAAIVMAFIGGNAYTDSQKGKS